jgi:uncharacterized protein YqjF (DUF2071 family)
LIKKTAVFTAHKFVSLVQLKKPIMPFLKAEWRKLAIANYKVDPAVLEKYLPFGTALDLWQGKAYLSLVGFMFLNTKILGVKIPFHSNFEEVNLRFYVKRLEGGEWKRGVVFIQEIVPKAALSFVARTVYNENYVTMPMSHIWEEKEDTRTVEYKWQKNKVWNSIKITADLNQSTIESASETEFITEHYWGYAAVNANRSNEYEVTHPKWNHYVVRDYEINIDFEATYGEAFGFLNNIEPSSVMLAEGSEITVEGKRKIKG